MDSNQRWDVALHFSFIEDYVFLATIQRAVARDFEVTKLCGQVRNCHTFNGW
jgi:hypothetical protein